MSDLILMIVHQEGSNPGLVGHILREMGYQLDIRCPALGDQLPPTMNHHRAVVVFGGPMSANDDETLPFIRTELDWIPIALASKQPFLGICLGAQLLARSLGAIVQSHPDDRVEIGYFPITPTAAGQTLFTALRRVYHWHQEGFDLPPGAKLLATGSTFPHQAFQYDHHAVGLQFHPEMTAELVNHWTTQGYEHLSKDGAQSRDEQVQHHVRYAPAVEVWLRSFLQDWLESSTCLTLSAQA